MNKQRYTFRLAPQSGSMPEEIVLTGRLQAKCSRCLTWKPWEDYGLRHVGAQVRNQTVCRACRLKSSRSHAAARAAQR